MGNKFRSSFEIKLNGVEYTLRPSFEAIMEFNDKAGKDVFDALQEMAQHQKLSIKVIVSCIWAGIKGEYEFQGRGLDCPSFKKIGNECQKHGYASCLPAAISFLSKSVASDNDLKKIEGELPPTEAEL
jgi:hypothetical protein